MAVLAAAGLCAGAVACAAVAAAQAPREPMATVFTFQGRGWGHGVGMSQYGARGQALAGRDAGAILRHYYRGTTLTTAPTRTVKVLLSSGERSIAVSSPRPWRATGATTDGRRAVPLAARATHTVRVGPVGGWRCCAAGGAWPSSRGRCGSRRRPAAARSRGAGAHRGRPALPGPDPGRAGRHGIRRRQRGGPRGLPEGRRAARDAGRLGRRRPGGTAGPGGRGAQLRDRDHEARARSTTSTTTTAARPTAASRTRTRAATGPSRARATPC